MKSINPFHMCVTIGLAIAAGGSATALAQTGNTAFGTSALLSNTTGGNNSAFGEGALASNTTGNNNTASGYETLLSNINGANNTANGYQALLSNTNGNDNFASGYRALFANIIGIENIAIGNYALYRASGNNNIAIGYEAGYWTTGNNNIHIGHPGVTNDNNVIRIGKQGVQKFTAIAGINGVNVTGGAAVVVNKQGQLGVELSSIRYKEDVQSMGAESARLLKLRPVTFHYKQPDESGNKPKRYGLIAEEVAKVMPELVIYNTKGQPETVAYQDLAPLLLNELQKDHERMEQMQAEIDELRKSH